MSYRQRKGLKRQINDNLESTHRKLLSMCDYYKKRGILNDL